MRSWYFFLQENCTFEPMDENELKQRRQEASSKKNLKLEKLKKRDERKKLAAG